MMILLLKEDEWRCIANLMFDLGCKCNVAQANAHKFIIIVSEFDGERTNYFHEA